MTRLFVASVAVLVCACASQNPNTQQTAPVSNPTAGAQPAPSAQPVGQMTNPPAASAQANLEGRSGSQLTGVARFTPAQGGVAVHLEVRDAPPGEHGVHVHEKGDCSDPKAASAGGHFNPGQAAHHGGPTGDVRHGGDLGNLRVGTDGRGTLDVTVQGLGLDDGPRQIVGRAIVVHEKIDDLKSDPAGNSGARIGCGVITAASP